MQKYSGEIVKDEVTGITDKRTTIYIWLDDTSTLHTSQTMPEKKTRVFHSINLIRVAKKYNGFLVGLHHEGTVLEFVKCTVIGIK